VAQRIGVEPSYLSKIERGLETRLSEEATRALAAELGEDFYQSYVGARITDLAQLSEVLHG